MVTNYSYLNDFTVGEPELLTTTHARASRRRACVRRLVVRSSARAPGRPPGGARTRGRDAPPVRRVRLTRLLAVPVSLTVADTVGVERTADGILCSVRSAALSCREPVQERLSLLRSCGPR